MGHYLSEMESSAEAERRYTSAMNLQARQKAGYWHPQAKAPRYDFGSVEVLHHLPCGLAVYDPTVHDPLCPANGNGRTEPMLGAD